MKFGVLALDYDGTISNGAGVDPFRPVSETRQEGGVS